MVYLLISFIFILGTAIGSFLNVLVDRIPRGESINGRSHCEFCRRTLGFFDLIPMISFIALRGRCRYCNKKLSFQYIIMEIVTGGLFVLVWFFVPTQSIMTKTAYLFLFSCLLSIFLIDAKHRVIPTALQLVFFSISTAILIVEQTTITGFGFRVVEALLVALPIYVLYAITRERAMGFGDVELALNIGFLLGLKAGFIALYFGFIFGGTAGLILLLLRKKNLKSKIAFGPFLIMGLAVMIFFEKPIISILSRIYRLS